MMMLRRPIYYLLGMPITSLFGIDWGVFFLNFIGVALSSYVIKTRLGYMAAIALVFSLHSVYWVGNMAPNAWYIPAGFLVLFSLSDELKKKKCESLKTTSIIMAIASLTYDLYPFFIAPYLYLVFTRNKYFEFVKYFLGPIVGWNLFIGLFGDSTANSQSSIIWDTIKSYLSTFNEETSKLLLENFYLAIRDLPENFLSSQFLITGLVSIAVLLFPFMRRHHQNPLDPMVLWIFASFFILYFFLQSTPTPLDNRESINVGIKGTWCARIYQILFIPCLLFILSKGKKFVVITTVFVQFLICLGFLSQNPISVQLAHRFYKHGSTENVAINLDRLGYRPLGFCKGKE